MNSNKWQVTLKNNEVYFIQAYNTNEAYMIAFQLYGINNIKWVQFVY
jgi:hypothetical protein